MRNFKINVKGLVQGVYFRASTRDKAISLGLTGWVKNAADGSVLVEAEGEEESLHVLVDWLHQGPPAAQVSTVTVHEAACADYQEFSIKR